MGSVRRRHPMVTGVRHMVTHGMCGVVSSTWSPMAWVVSGTREPMACQGSSVHDKPWHGWSGDPGESHTTE